MSDQHSSPRDDAGQYPHSPGQDPDGSGEPRQPEPTGQEDSPPRSPVVPESQRDTAGGAEQPGGHTGAPEDIPAHNTAPDGQPGDSGDAPLGGDETTEQQLEADTAVERDALKGLDPDDSPA
ncbi:hypothetical protein [Microbacterium sp.]|uniref:hypothetical protein n=1 Tax=Microbacterium sp. TaxID=51671 RepID=UPI002810E94C|nr:hypothetical protein [Microbacterium sp.]